MGYYLVIEGIKYCCMLQYGCNLKALGQVKEARHKRLPNAFLHLYELIWNKLTEKLHRGRKQSHGSQKLDRGKNGE
jgi:hypothetical protein